MSIKLNAQSGGSVALDAPTQTTSSADNVYKLPVADGSAGQVLQTDGSGNLSWVTLPTGGLSVAQEWSFAGYPVSYQNTTDLTSWNARAGNVGSSMTHSSGVFTFPSTGIYNVHASNTSIRISAEARYFTIFTYLSTDGGSSWNLQKENYGNINNDASSISTFNNQVILDITNTSTHKVKFAIAAETTVSLSTTFVQFFKLGET